VSTAQELPVAFGVPSALLDEAPAAPLLRLVPSSPLDFEAAVRAVRPRLHRYATRRLGDVHEAEELVQEALLRAYSHRDKLLTEEDLAAWSTVVTGRLVIDRLRVRNRSTSVAEVPESGRTGRDTADVVVARDEARTALDALDAMPTRQAAVLWAREVEGDSYEDLCTRFGMSEPAVRSILTRARKSLRHEYATRGGTLPVGGLAILAPWLAGLTWADRLRQAAHRLTAPAVLATIGITALGGLVLAPFGTGQPAFTPRPAVISDAPAAQTSATRVVPDVARTSSARESITPSATDEIPGEVAPKLIDRTQLPCTPGSPVQSASCAPAAKGAFISVGPNAPENPVLRKQTGVTVSDYDCTGWKANPVVSCTPGGADR